jgi:hypothetical protein
MSPREKPKLIYKYESFSNQSLRNLKAQSLYFGSPRGFNDPYDCALNVRIQELTNQELAELRTKYSQSDTPEQFKKALSAMDDDSFGQYLSNAMKTAIREHVDSFLNKNGVTCFSERNDNLLMWSHYGQACRGFCLEFSTEYEPFNLMRPITYSPDIPSVNCASILKGDDKFIDALFSTKSDSWSYEKEWRIINHEITPFVYESSALRSIYFGPDVDDESLEIVCLIIKGQNPNVLFWKGQRSEEKFEVNFRQFSYASFIEGKDAGLNT